MLRPRPLIPLLKIALGCRQIRGDLFTLPRVWEGLKHKCDFQQRRAAVAAFNEAHTWTKRGICMVPCRHAFHPASSLAPH